jgi:hypothetical protein
VVRIAAPQQSGRGLRPACFMCFCFLGSIIFGDCTTNSFRSSKNYYAIASYCFQISPHGSTAPLSLSLLYEVSRSRSRHATIRFPWTSDRPDAETSTKQHTTLTRNRHPSSRRDSNPQSQQASGRRPTP